MRTRGSQPGMGMALGGTAAVRTRTPLIPRLGSPPWGCSRCWLLNDASRRFHEPPDAEPQVRWCGRTAGVTPPPTRCTPELQRLFRLLQRPHLPAQESLRQRRQLVVLQLALLVQFHLGLRGFAAPALPLLSHVPLVVCHSTSP